MGGAGGQPFFGIITRGLQVRIAASTGGAMMQEKQFKQVCQCKNCGNEAEMVVTCQLEGPLTGATPHIVAEGEGTTKGHAVCTHCGSEADIWLDV